MGANYHLQHTWSLIKALSSLARALVVHFEKDVFGHFGCGCENSGLCYLLAQIFAAGDLSLCEYFTCPDRTIMIMIKRIFVCLFHQAG